MDETAIPILGGIRYLYRVQVDRGLIERFVQFNVQDLYERFRAVVQPDLSCCPIIAVATFVMKVLPRELCGQRSRCLGTDWAANVLGRQWGIPIERVPLG